MSHAQISRGIYFPDITTVITLTRPTLVTATFYPTNSSTAVEDQFVVGQGSTISYRSSAHRPLSEQDNDDADFHAALDLKVRGNWLPEELTSLRVVRTLNAAIDDALFPYQWTGKAKQIVTGAPTFSAFGYRDITGVLQDPPRETWRMGPTVASTTRVILEEAAVFRVLSLREAAVFDLMSLDGPPENHLEYLPGRDHILGPGTTFTFVEPTSRPMRLVTQRIRLNQRGARRELTFAPNTPSQTFHVHAIVQRLDSLAHSCSMTFISTPTLRNRVRSVEWRYVDVESDRVVIAPYSHLVREVPRIIR